jgi:hypothetical protein
MSMEAKQTPLIESLERVPQDARVVVEHDQFSSSSHPVGRLCHEAAAELRRLHAEVERLRTDGASAVRWAPGSAYWSDVLRDLFGPDARDGINVVEARWRAELERADTAEALLWQALEALEFFRDTAICEADTAVATEAIAALHERLGKGMEQKA